MLSFAIFFFCCVSHLLPAAVWVRTGVYCSCFAAGGPQGPWGSGAADGTVWFHGRYARPLHFVWFFLGLCLVLRWGPLFLLGKRAAIFARTLFQRCPALRRHASPLRWLWRHAVRLRARGSTRSNGRTASLRLVRPRAPRRAGGKVHFQGLSGAGLARPLVAFFSRLWGFHCRALAFRFSFCWSMSAGSAAASLRPFGTHRSGTSHCSGWGTSPPSGWLGSGRQPAAHGAFRRPAAAAAPPPLERPARDRSRSRSATLGAAFVAQLCFNFERTVRLPARPRAIAAPPLSWSLKRAAAADGQRWPEVFWSFWQALSRAQSRRRCPHGEKRAQLLVRALFFSPGASLRPARASFFSVFASLSAPGQVLSTGFSRRWLSSGAS